MSTADKFKEMSRGLDLAQAIAEADRCLRCGDEIRRIEIANRTCYYCPTDQPGP